MTAPIRGGRLADITVAAPAFEEEEVGGLASSLGLKLLPEDEEVEEPGGFARSLGLGAAESRKGDPILREAAQLAIGGAESAIATTRGITAIARLPEKFPALQFFPPAFLAMLVARGLDPTLEEGAKAARELLPPETGTETAFRVGGRIAGDIAQIIGSGGAAAPVKALTLKALLKAPAPVAARVASAAPTISTAAAGVARSVPLTATQSAAGREESISGVISDALQDHGVDNVVTRRLAEAVENPAERIAIDVAADVALGTVVEAGIPLFRRMFRRSRASTRVADGEPLTRIEQLRRNVGERGALPELRRPLESLAEAEDRVRAGVHREAGSAAESGRSARPLDPPVAPLSEVATTRQTFIKQEARNPLDLSPDELEAERVFLTDGIERHSAELDGRTLARMQVRQSVLRSMREPPPGAATALDTPEVVAMRRAQPTDRTVDIKTPQREADRFRWGQQHYGTGAERREREMVLIIGLPASGKSGALADPAVRQFGALLIDADEVKKFIPEFEQGKFAGRVHKESSDVVELDVLPRALDAGDNIVMPIVGKNQAVVDRIIEGARRRGYRVHLQLNELPQELAAIRAIQRLNDTGRFVDPAYILEEVDGKPTRTYEALRNDPRVASFRRTDNNVPFGTAPRVVEDGINPGAVEPAAGRRVLGEQPPGGVREVARDDISRLPVEALEDRVGVLVDQADNLGLLRGGRESGDLAELAEAMSRQDLVILLREVGEDPARLVRLLRGEEDLAALLAKEGGSGGLLARAGAVPRETVQTLAGAGVGAVAGAVVAPEGEAEIGALAGAALGAGAAAAVRRGLGPRRPRIAPTGTTAPEVPPVAEAVDRAAPATRQASLGVSAPVPGEVQFNKFGLSAEGQDKLQQTVEGMGRIRRSVTDEEVLTAGRRLGMEDIVRADLNDQVDGVTMLGIRLNYQSNVEQITALNQSLKELETPAGVKRLRTAEQRQRAEWRLQQDIAELDRENDALLRIFIPRASDAGRTLRSLQILAKQAFDDPFPWIVKGSRLAGRDLLPEERAAIETLIARGDRQGLLTLMRTMAAATKTFSLEGFNLIRKAGLLTGLRTQSRNFLSNTAEGLLREADSAPAVMADKLMSLMVTRLTEGRVTGLRTRTVLSLADRIKASRRGVNVGMENFRKIMQGVEVDEGTLRRLDLRREVALDNKVADTYVKFMFRLQGAADQPFRQVAFMSSVVEQSRLLGRAKGLKGAELEKFIDDTLERTPDDIAFQAVLDSEEAVFQNKSTIGAMIGRAKTGLATKAAGRGLEAQTAKGVAAALDFVVPFSQTPSAILGRLIERTPIGLVSSTAGLVDLWRLAKGGASATELAKVQRQIATRFGRAATGSVALAAGYTLAQSGLLTGRWPTDQKEAKRWIQEGKTEDSIQLGGRWSRISGLSPIGNLVAIGGQLYHDTNNLELEPQSETISLVAQAGTNVMLGALRTVKEQSFLRGVNDLLQAIDDERGMATRYAFSSAGSFVPIIVGDFARFMDPVLRNPTNFPEAIASRVPFASVTVPASLDEFGRPKVDPASLGTGPLGVPARVTRLVDPTLSRQKRDANDPVLRELNRVGATVPRKTKRAGEDEATFRTRQAFEGEQEMTAIMEATQNRLYRALSTPDQQEVLQDVISAVRRQLRDGGRVPSSWRGTVNDVARRARARALRRR